MTYHVMGFCINIFLISHCRSQLLVDGFASRDVHMLRRGYGGHPSRGIEPSVLDASFVINMEGNGTTTDDGSDNNYASLDRIKYLIIALVSGVFLAIAYHCCCRQSTEGYYDGKPAERGALHRGHEDEEIPSPMDEETALNTAVNASSRFVTADQYLDLFKGNYKHKKSRKVSAHAYRLGICHRTPLVSSARDLTPKEIELKQYFEESQQEGDLVPYQSSCGPKKWVQWADECDVIDDVEDQLDATNDDNIEDSKIYDDHLSEDEMKDDDSDDRQGMTFEWQQPRSDSPRSSSLILTTTDTSDSDDERMKIIGFNPQIPSSHSINERIDYSGLPTRYELALASKKEGSHDEKKKRLHNIFKKTSLSLLTVGDVSKTKFTRQNSSQLSTEEPAEERHDEPKVSPPLTYSQCVPIPTRFSPPPAAQPSLNKPRNQQHNNFSPISLAAINPRPLSTGNNPLMRQNVVEPQRLGTKLKMLQEKARNAKNKISKQLSSESASSGELHRLAPSSSSSSTSSSSHHISPESKSKSNVASFSPSHLPVFLKTTSAEDNSAKSSFSPPPPPPLPPEKKVPIDNFLSQFPPELQQFVKMLNVGVPADAVKYKMEASGVDPTLLDSYLDDSACQSPPPSAAFSFPVGGYEMPVMSTAQPPPPPLPPEKKVPIDNFLSQFPPELQQFVKMLNVGVPADAVKYKMEASGVDPTLLDSYLEDSGSGTNSPSPRTALAFSGPVGGYEMPKSTTSRPPPPPIPAEKKIPLNNFLSQSTADSDIQQFVKMLKVGVPAMAVKNRMEASGIDSSLLDSYMDDC